MTSCVRGRTPRCYSILWMNSSMCLGEWGQMTSIGNAWLPMRSCHLPCSVARSREASLLTPAKPMEMHLPWWMWMMRRGLSGSPGPFRMVCSGPGIPCSSRASMTGCRSWWVPIACCSRENTISIIAPHAPQHPLM